MDPIRIYDYLAMSRQRVLDAAGLLTPAQYVQAFPFGLKTVGATLTHIVNCEWAYIERLGGRPVPPFEQWAMKEEDPPAVAVVESKWREQATRARAAVAAERDWGRRITYTRLPDQNGKRWELTATAGDIFTQLALHEVHHRAQVMAMLRGLGRPVEDIDFNDLMYERREIG